MASKSAVRQEVEGVTQDDVAPGQHWRETAPTGGGRTFLVNELIGGELAVISFLGSSRRGRIPTRRLTSTGGEFELVDRMPRDPRISPRPGDILQSSIGGCFHVRAVIDGAVLYQEDGTGELLQHSVRSWIDDAQADTVICVADSW